MWIVNEKAMRFITRMIKEDAHLEMNLLLTSG
jgi:hypothetical protein